MPFVEFPETAMYELVFSQHNEVLENTIYLRGNADFDALDLELGCETLATWWGDHVAPNVSNTVLLTQIKARAMHVQFGPIYEFTPNTTLQGELTSPSMPGNVTFSIKFTSGIAGRRARGRNYFVGLVEAQVSGNEIVTTELNAIIAAYEQLPIEVTGAMPFVDHVIASRAAAVGPSWIGTTYPVISYSADGFVDSQRRRLAGRGS